LRNALKYAWKMPENRLKTQEQYLRNAWETRPLVVRTKASQIGGTPKLPPPPKPLKKIRKETRKEIRWRLKRREGWSAALISARGSGPLNIHSFKNVNGLLLTIK
jgi:hypothetical protein